MSSHSPYQTTAQNMQAVLESDALQRANQGAKNLLHSRLVHEGTPNSGHCRWGAQFEYSDGTVETIWGA